MDTQLQQVNTLVLQAVNGATDQNGRDAIANQIDQIRQSLLGLANTQYGNRPLFGGTVRRRGRVRLVRQLRRDFGARSQRTIAPGVQVQVNVNGDTVFGPPGNDMFTTLAQISDAIHGNTVADRAERPAQDADAERRRPRRRWSARPTPASIPPRAQNTTNASTMTQNLSNVEDVDMAQVLMNLQAQETTYQAALAAAAKAIQPSLAAFLQ